VRKNQHPVSPSNNLTGFLTPAQLLKKVRMFEDRSKKWVRVVFIILVILMLIFTILPFLGSI